MQSHHTVVSPGPLESLVDLGSIPDCTLGAFLQAPVLFSPLDIPCALGVTIPEFPHSVCTGDGKWRKLG